MIISRTLCPLLIKEAKSRSSLQLRRKKGKAKRCCEERIFSLHASSLNSLQLTHWENIETHLKFSAGFPTEAQAGYPVPSSFPRCLENPHGFPRAEATVVLLNTQQQLLDDYQTHLYPRQGRWLWTPVWGPQADIFPFPHSTGKRPELNGAGTAAQAAGPSMLCYGAASTETLRAQDSDWLLQCQPPRWT